MADGKNISKNIIICCDGTGNEYCETNTNIVRLFEIIEKNNPGQIAYYDPGVGTIGSRAAVTRIGKKITRILGLAFGLGMTRNIEEAYEFLMDNFEDNDRIYLFGFSRGAYTVRAIGGLLLKCGLLHRNCQNQIPYAMKIYREYKMAADNPIARGFRETFSRTCIPYFIGVWDTVKATGLFKSYTFSDCFLNKNIKFGYHALAIDERRSKFKQVPWNPAAENQTIEQVWFPGVHSDIGGGYPENGLSEIALKWMTDKAVVCGLKIDQEKYNFIAPDFRTNIHKSYKGWWRLLGTHKREIKEDSWVSKCAYVKKDDCETYCPKNLPEQDKVKLIGESDDCS